MPTTSLPITRPRTPLARTCRALRDGSLTVGYVGGSITDGRSGTNWPHTVTAWLVDQFPHARIREENAAIGATGSDLAVFRAERDLLAPDCDLVFVEYAVNDQGTDPVRRARSREGLVRKLLQEPDRDVVLAYTFGQPMYDDLKAGRVPASIADFEEIADHYGVPSVWMGLQAWRDVERGLLTWDGWLPDGLHPGPLGSSVYAGAVTAFLDQALRDPAPDPRRERPPPLHPGCWERTMHLPWPAIATDGPWSLQRCTVNIWMDHVLATAAPGASLHFDFEGRGLVLGLDFGKAASDFRYRLDDGPWVPVPLDRPDWCPPRGWFRPCVLLDEDAARSHRFELEVVHPGAAATFTHFRLAFAGVIQEARGR